MHGFSGPFRFDVDSEGTLIPWAQLDEDIRVTLIKGERFTEKNSNVYRFRIAVISTDRQMERHHDWSKVNRVCIQAELPAPGLAIAGVYPRDKKVAELSQTDMAYMVSLQGQVRLFDVLRLRLTLSSSAKRLARQDRFAVLSSFNSNVAQWVYSPGWDSIGFDAYLYVAVHKSVEEKHRAVYVSIKPTRKGDKVLTQAQVWRHTVQLPRPDGDEERRVGTPPLMLGPLQPANGIGIVVDPLPPPELPA
jgi:hypothetical protein